MENTTNSHSSAGTLLERFDRSRLATVLIFAVVAIGFFMMVHNTPLVWDDFGYSLERAATPPKHISDFGGLFSSSIHHYMVQNGRFANAPLCMILEWIGKPTTDFITTGVFLLLGVFVYKLIGVPSRRNSLFVLIFGLSFLLAPAFGQTMLWLCGSANYLWATTAVLAFLLIFRKTWNGWNPHWAVFVPVLLLSVIAGWMHEAPSVGICAGVFFYMLIHRKEVSVKTLLLFAAFVAGTALVVFAPGTMNRAEHMSYGLSVQIVKTAFGVGVLIFLTPVVTVLLAVLVWLFFKSRETFFRALKKNQLLLLIVAGSLPLLAAFSRDGRGTCALFFFALAGLLGIWAENVKRSRERFYSTVVVLVALASIGVFTAIIPELVENKRVNEALYAECAKNESDVVVFDDLPKSTTGDQRYLLAWKLMTLHNPTGWQASGIARYYNVPRFGVFSRAFIDSIYTEDNFCVPANEVIPGWYSREDLDFYVRKEMPSIAYADPVSCRYRIVWEKMNLAQRTACLILEKIGLMADGGEAAYSLNDATPPRTVFTMQFPSGKYSFLLKRNRIHLLQVEELEIK